MLGNNVEVNHTENPKHLTQEKASQALLMMKHPEVLGLPLQGVIHH